MTEVNGLARLLVEAGSAHHTAYLSTDGVDPEWPLWYAEHLHPRVRDVLGVELTQAELVYLLVSAARNTPPD